MIDIREMFGLIRDAAHSLPSGLQFRIEAEKNYIVADNVFLSAVEAEKLVGREGLIDIYDLVPAWQVSVEKYWHGNRENPPEVEEIFIGTVGGNETQAAINMFITTVVENRLNMFWDKKADEAMAKALENEHE